MDVCIYAPVKENICNSLILRAIVTGRLRPEACENLLDVSIEQTHNQYTAHSAEHEELLIPPKITLYTITQLAPGSLGGRECELI